MRTFNDQIINNLNTEKVTFPCHDTVLSPSMKLADQTKLISRLTQDPTVTANSENSLFKNQLRNKPHLHIKRANKLKMRFIPFKLKRTIWVLFALLATFFKHTSHQESFR